VQKAASAQRKARAPQQASRRRGPRLCCSPALAPTRMAIAHASLGSMPRALSSSKLLRRRKRPRRGGLGCFHASPCSADYTAQRVSIMTHLCTTCASSTAIWSPIFALRSVLLVRAVYCAIHSVPACMCREEDHKTSAASSNNRINKWVSGARCRTVCTRHPQPSGQAGAPRSLLTVLFLHDAVL